MKESRLAGNLAMVLETWLTYVINQSETKNDGFLHSYHTFFNYLCCQRGAKHLTQWNLIIPNIVYRTKKKKKTPSSTA